MAILLASKRPKLLVFEEFDEGYLDRLTRGDRATEEHFSNYFGRLILIKLRRRVRSAQLVEDVRQETFLRVLRILRSEQGVRRAEGLGSLVNSVCNNVLLETWRSLKRHPPVPETGWDPADQALNPERELLSSEQRRAVRAVIDEMPEQDRELLGAVFLEEQEREAVCARLGVGRDYLRVLLHRAKRQFRTRYASSERPRLQEVPRDSAGAGSADQRGHHGTR